MEDKKEEKIENPSKDNSLNNEKNEPNTSGIIRDKKGRFVKGVSGNPTGRPEGTLSLVSLLRKKLQAIAPNSQKTWAELFIDKMFFTAINDKGDPQLMKDIIDRIDGKPKQNIGLDTNDMIEKIEIEIIKSRKNNDTQTENNIGVGEKLSSLSGQNNQDNSKSGRDRVK